MDVALIVADGSPVLVAAIVAIPASLAAISGPMLLARQIANRARKDKLEDQERQAEDRKRQDEVAAQTAVVAKKAEETADLLLEAQRDRDDRTDEVARLAAQTATATGVALGEMKVVVDQTHLLVNSNMMKEMRHRLVLMKELVDVKRRLGEEPSQEALAEISDLDRSISDLLERTEGAEVIAVAAAAAAAAAADSPKAAD